MNKKANIIGGAIVAVVIVGGILYYCEQRSLDQKEQQLNEQIARFQEYLPVGYKQSNQLTKGVFQSQGIYTLSYDAPKIPESKLPDMTSYKITVNYHIDHGLKSLFTHQVNIDATSRLEGPLTQILKTNGDFIKTTGTVDSDGSFHLVSKSNTMNLVFADEISKANIVISPIDSTSEFNQKTGEVKTNSNIPSIIAELSDTQIGNDKIELKEINITRDFKMNDPYLGTFNIKLDTMTTRYGEVKNAALQSSMLLNNNKYDLGINILGNVKLIQTKSPLVIDMKYSLNGLNKEAIDNYRKLHKDNKNTREASIETKEQYRQNLVKLIQAGLTLNIDKLNVKGDFGSVEAKGQWLVNPIESKIGENKDKISLSNQSKIMVNIKSEGAVTSWLMSTVGVNLLGLTPPDNMKNYQLNVTYQQGGMEANQKPIAENFVEPFNYVLQTLDEQWNMPITEEKIQAAIDNTLVTNETSSENNVNNIIINGNKEVDETKIIVPKNSDVTVTIKQ